MRALAGALLVVTTIAAPAAAQERTVHVRAFGGVTFMSETATVYGAGVGFRPGGPVEIVGEMGRMTNVLPHRLQRDLDDAARAIGSLFGGPLRIDGRAPAIYGLGAVRVGRLTASGLRLYAEAGAGATRGTSDIRAVAGSLNVSREIVTALGIKRSETAPLITLGGGLSVPVHGTIAVDLGYRFMRIFTDEPRISTANMSAALRWGF
jgi:hypothetical protein